LIDLARCRFDKQNGFILEGLPNRCSDDTGVSGADGVDAHFLAAAIATDDLLQSRARVFGLRFHSCGLYSG
jgi:hypothetical protein